MGTLAPACEEAVRTSFARQGLMRHLGVRIVSLDEGEAVLELPYGEHLTQQQGGFHGGAVGALADVAAGYAAMTVVEPGVEVTTAEYKINLLAAFSDGALRAHGRVLRAGKRLIVTTAEVRHVGTDGRVGELCAVMQQTIATVRKQY